MIVVFTKHFLHYGLIKKTGMTEPDTPCMQLVGSSCTVHICTDATFTICMFIQYNAVK